MIGDPVQMRLTYWDGRPPSCGEYMQSAGGTRYRVISFTPTRGENPSSVGRVEMVKLLPGEAIPEGECIVHQFMWNPRSGRNR